MTIWQMVERRRPFEGMDGMQICALWISDPAQMVLPALTLADNACEQESCVACCVRLAGVKVVELMNSGEQRAAWALLRTIHSKL
jgi:hypothetical protein